jgi:hypothetical protein
MDSKQNLNFLKPNKQSDQTWEQVFSETAKELFTNWTILANGTEYEIVEIEFYYDSPLDEHLDPFIYDDIRNRNLKFGTWFFHYSGVDITFGDDVRSRGGILIRGIYDKQGDRYVIGPLKTLLELLNRGVSVSSKNGIDLCLQKVFSTNDLDMVSDVRKGLDKSKKEKYPEEAKRLYRFVNKIKLIKEKDVKQYKQYYADIRS